MRARVGMWLALAVSQIMSGASFNGQDGAEKSSAGPVATLRVVTSRVQFTSLVMKDMLHPVLGLNADDFLIHIEDKKPFHPKYLRMATDDPLTVVVFVDLSRKQAFHRTIADGLAAMRDTSLRSDDRLYLYALDCKLLHARGDLRTGDQAKVAFERILQSPELRNEKSKSCGGSAHLWDNVIGVLEAISEMPGRHAMLLISDGISGHSKRLPQDVVHAASTASAPIYLLPSMNGLPITKTGKLVEYIASFSGGVVLDAPDYTVGPRLKTFISLLRSRYVLEFPRPNELETGTHLFEITVNMMSMKSNIIVRSTGTWAAVANKRDLHDKNMVKYDEFDGPALDQDPKPVPGEPAKK